jgi:hypothetical protein
MIPIALMVNPVSMIFSPFARKKPFNFSNNPVSSAENQSLECKIRIRSPEDR